MKNNNSILEGNLKFVKEILSKSFDTESKLYEEVESLIKNGYKYNLLDSFYTKEHYVYIYKLNQSINALTPIIRNQITNRGENLFTDEEKLARRFLLSAHFLSGEIQLLIEQNYDISALGKARALIELLAIYKLCTKNDDMYIDMLMHGNYRWREIEDLFNPIITEESKSFDEFIKNNYSDDFLKKPRGYISDKIDKSFNMTKYVKEEFKDNKILIMAWDASHSFVHSSSLLFAMDEKAHMHNNMAEYILPFASVVIFTVLSEILEVLYEAQKSNKHIYAKMEWTPIIDTTRYIKIWAEQSREKLTKVLEMRLDKTK